MKMSRIIFFGLIFIGMVACHKAPLAIKNNERYKRASAEIENGFADRGNQPSNRGATAEIITAENNEELSNRPSRQALALRDKHPRLKPFKVTMDTIIQ